MLDNFEVSQFGAFNHLRLDRLARVNLIVGRNNSGKTMLLEALRLYFAGGRPDAIVTLLTGRDEVHLNPEDSTSRRNVEVNLNALYHGRHPNFRNTGIICLGPVGRPSEQLKLILAWVRREERETTIRAAYRVVVNEQAEHDPDVELGLVVMQGDSVEVIYPASYFGRSSLQERLSLRVMSRPVFVPAGNMDPREIGRWWDAITLTAAEDRVLDCLRLVVPIERISMVEHPSLSKRIPMVRTKQDSEPVSLKSMGDGMFRMLQIALAMESATMGSPFQPSLFESASSPHAPLLIDEVENGIHYSVLEELWRFIFAGARSNGVQVFATTHSWDCIRAFQQAAAAADQDEALLVRLECTAGETRAITFDRRELAIVTRDDIEVR